MLQMLYTVFYGNLPRIAYTAITNKSFFFTLSPFIKLILWYTNSVQPRPLATLFHPLSGIGIQQLCREVWWRHQWSLSGTCCHAILGKEWTTSRDIWPPKASAARIFKRRNNGKLLVIKLVINCIFKSYLQTMQSMVTEWEFIYGMWK